MKYDTGSTKFIRFEMVTSSCVTSLTDRPVASARCATLGIQKHSEPALLKLNQIKHTINRESQRSSVAMCLVCAMASRTGSGTAGMFTPGGAWIVPCNKPAAKVRALACIFSLLCRRFLASSDNQLFLLLSTDTSIPEDFADLRVP